MNHIRAAYNPNPKRHSRNNRLENSIRKHGPEAFDFKVVFSTNNRKEALKKEQELIKIYGTRSPIGYNSTDGGEGNFGWVPSDIVRKKMSKAIKKARQNPNSAHNSPEYHKKMSKATKKAWQNPNSAHNTPECRKKMSDAQKKAWQDPKYRERMTGENSPMCKLLEEDVIEIHKLDAAGHTRREIATRSDVSQRQIGRIIRHEEWAWLK